jgi:hypothetical protein
MKSFVKYGLRTGIFSGIWLFGSFIFVSWLNRMYFNQSIPEAQIRGYSGLFSILILVIGIYAAMRQVKVRNGDALAYGQAVKTGILVGCITGVIVGLFGLLYCTVINPGYTEFMVNDAKNVLIAAGKSPQEIAQRLEGVRKEFSTGSQVIMALVGQTVVGSIASLILGLFMRTKKDARSMH